MRKSYHRKGPLQTPMSVCQCKDIYELKINVFLKITFLEIIIEMCILACILGARNIYYFVLDSYCKYNVNFF